MNLYENISTKLNESGVSGKLYLVKVKLYISEFYGLGKTIDEAYDNAVSQLLSDSHFTKFNKKQLHSLHYAIENIEDLRDMEVLKQVSVALISVFEFDSGKVVNSYYLNRN